jgi:hypothetical protein
MAWIAAAHSRYGGSWTGYAPYQYGRIDDILYPVRGGMDEWAYAGSWDLANVQPCNPTTYGGYAPEKTIYSNSTLRMFTMLIETSDDKAPLTSLGTSLFVLDPASPGNGHVPRNIRMSLLAMDIVEPYVWLTTVNDTALSEDVVPLQQRSVKSCRMERALSVSPTADLSSVKVDWKVGGALQVDQSILWYAKWDTIPLSLLDCLSQPSTTDIQTWFQRGTAVGATNGTTEFSPAIQAAAFLATIDLSSFSPGDEIVVLASARVDQSWSQRPENFAPQLPPQSHIANVRTNPLWYHESEQNIIQGRLDWFSLPFTIVIGERTVDPAGEKQAPSQATVRPVSIIGGIILVLFVMWI